MYKRAQSIRKIRGEWQRIGNATNECSKAPSLFVAFEFIALLILLRLDCRVYHRPADFAAFFPVPRMGITANFFTKLSDIADPPMAERERAIVNRAVARIWSTTADLRLAAQPPVTDANQRIQ